MMNLKLLGGAYWLSVGGWFLVAGGCTELDVSSLGDEPDGATRQEADGATNVKVDPELDGGKLESPVDGGADGGQTCVAVRLYADEDGDGQGDVFSFVDSCVSRAGYVANATDCDDSCATCGVGNEEICDGVDNDCDGDTDEVVVECGSAVGVCKMGTQSCAAGDVGMCVGAIGPIAEVCDGLLDEDCDGAVDESCACFDSVPRPCGSSIGACSPGVQQCTAGQWGTCDGAIVSTPEVCDGVDNNCDGEVDEGTLNACNECGVVPAEVCDGVDNNCDGDVDEGTLNACNECGVVPAEVCDGVDNNCDGNVDEGTLNACNECGVVPAEVCDGVDNNCDGNVDEGTLNACNECGVVPAEVCDGVDNNCDGEVDEGTLNACNECGVVPTEICDGVDNNCDGRVDEDAGLTCDWKVCGSAGSCAPVAEIAVGYKHTCARLTSGAVYCWGDNFQGQLGNGNNNGSAESLPQRVVALDGVNFLSGALGITAGSTHTCARLTDSIVCWGANDVGQLGNSTAGASRSTPITVQSAAGISLNSVEGVDAGDSFTCARLASGGVACWGDNAQGALGNGSSSSGSFSALASPVLGEGSASALTQVAQISAGAFHACARLESTNVVCWGFNFYGQVGNDVATQSNAKAVRPERVVDIGGAGSLTSVASVSAGGSSSCAVLTNKEAVCWGGNGGGQLGQPSSSVGSWSSSPVVVQGEGSWAKLSNIVQVSLGHGGHVCGRLSSGQAVCWGSNYSGQLGNGASGSGAGTDRPVGVVPVGASTGRMTGVAQVAAGTNHSCILLDTGVVACFGMNDVGQFGNGTTAQSQPLPSEVSIPQ